MTLKLNMLPPSVNNMSVRVFVRAAGLPFEEENVWGRTQSDEYRAKIPSGLTPSVETEGLPKGALWESCAVMMYLANREGLTSLYPADLERRAMVDSANFYTMSILYPLVARATYAALAFPHYPGEVGASDADEAAKAVAQQACEAAVAEPLDVYRTFFLDGKQFIGGATPSIADIRLAATLEFLRAIDYEFPAWAEDYMAAMEDALGEAYSEPAADVRGYVDYVKGQAA